MVLLILLLIVLLFACVPFVPFFVKHIPDICYHAFYDCIHFLKIKNGKIIVYLVCIYMEACLVAVKH